MALHLQPMTSRERASACALAVFIAVLVWIGAFGCMSSPTFAFNHPDLKRLHGVHQGMSLKEFRELCPAVVPSGHKVVDGVQIDAYIGESFQANRYETPVPLKRWHYFYEDRLVSWCDHEDWTRVANDLIKWREAQKAETIRVQRALEAARAAEAARNAPMGDSR